MSSAYYMPGTVPDARGAVIKKRDAGFALLVLLV